MESGASNLLAIIYVNRNLNQKKSPNRLLLYPNSLGLSEDEFAKQTAVKISKLHFI